MERQFLIDETYRRLVAQGGASATPDVPSPPCLYRAPGGKKCAAGHWIEDAAYHNNLEGNTIDDEEVDAVLPAALRAGQPLNKVLLALQQAHDEAAEAALIYGKSWPEALSAEFEKRGLNVTES